MDRVNPTEEFRRNMALSYNAAPIAPTIPSTFAILAVVIHPPRAYNRRVCEWRPRHYASDGFLEN